MGEVLAAVDLENGVHFQPGEGGRSLGLCFGIVLDGGRLFEVEQGKVLQWIILRSLFRVEILEKGRGRAVDLAVLIIIHGGIEAFSLRSSFHCGFKLLLHLVELL